MLWGYILPFPFVEAVSWSDAQKGNRTFKVKVSVFYRNTRFGESAGFPFIPGELMISQAWTCLAVLACRLSQKLRALQISPAPIACPDLPSKAPGIPAESRPMRLGSSFYLP